MLTSVAVPVLQVDPHLPAGRAHCCPVLSVRRLCPVTIKKIRTRFWMKRVRMNSSGAGGRTRTGTGVSPADFESATSANSITPACSRNKKNFNMVTDLVSIQRRLTRGPNGAGQSLVQCGDPIYNDPNLLKKSGEASRVQLHICDTPFGVCVFVCAQAERLRAFCLFKNQCLP